MANPLAVRAYYGITSQAFAAKSNLGTLFTNAYAARSNAELVPEVSPSELSLYGTDTNTVDILVGDAGMTTTDYAFRIVPTGERRYGPNRMSAIPMSDMYAMSADGVTQVKIGIELLPT